MNNANKLKPKTVLRCIAIIKPKKAIAKHRAK